MAGEMRLKAGCYPAPHSGVPAPKWLWPCELPPRAVGAGSKAGVRSALWGATGRCYSFYSFNDFVLSLSTFDDFTASVDKSR